MKNIIKEKVNVFFARRSPRSDEMSLGLKNVYIFFSRRGLLFALLLIITFIMGVNYSNNLVLGLFFYLFAIWLISVFYTFVQVASLNIQLIETSLTEAQSAGYVSVQVSTKSGKPSRQVALMFDAEHEITQKKLKKQAFDDFIHARTVVIANLDKPTIVKVPIHVSVRGVLTLPRLVVSSVYPMGVMRAWAYAYFASPMFVYPKPLSFDWQNNKQAMASETDKLSAISVVGQSDFEMLDEYQEGESLARVSWSHLAKGAGMLTKHFGDTLGHEWCVRYDDMPSATHEARLSELCYAVMSLGEQNVPFMLVLPSGVGQLGVGNEFVRACLIRLAKET